MHSSPPRILVVEDSRTQAQELCLVLEHAGFRVVIAHDGNTALKLLDEQRIDLVLSDVIMPGLSGYELSQAIRKRPSGSVVPIILLTSLNDPEDIVRGLASGADNFIIKPFEPAILVSRIERVLTNRAARTEAKATTGGSISRHEPPLAVHSDKEQILDLLLSTVDEFVRSKQREFEGRLAEESLRKSKDLLQSALDALSAGVAVLDESGHIIAANRAWNLLGRAQDPDGQADPVNIFTAAPSWGFHDPEVWPDIQAALGDISSGKLASFQREFAVGQDSAKWYLFSAQSCQHSEHARLVIAVEDITQRKRAENERTQRLLEEAARARAEAVSRAKDDFMAMLAHELRNPLAPIVSALEIVRSAAGDNATILESAAIMDRQVHQLIHLVDDLLDVARATSGKIQLHTSRIAVADVVANAVESSWPLINARHHQLHIHLPEERVIVEADFTRLAQVLANLLNNAAKYTEPGGQIWITARAVRGAIELSVRDSGIGIPADRLPQIFELFTQIEASLDRSQGGLGIGLSLVRRLVELHGGTVSAHSAGRGKGSEFRILLPEVVGNLPTTNRQESSETQATSAPLRVLVVDDNRDAADTMAMLLKLEKHEIQTAYDGEAALRIANRFRPHVMLLDIGLPKINGYEVARQLRSTPEHDQLYLVALTGYGQEEDRKRTLAAGFNDHLLKPVEIGLLRKALASAPRKNCHERID